MEIVKMEVREAGDGAAAGECVRVPPKKYTWAEVRQAVHDLRKQLSSLSTMVPMAISFRKLANGKTRIYFLRTPQNGWEITLLYTDVTPSVQPNNARLEWKPLIESNVALGVTSGKWSREEQLLWERQRVAAWGIASYELHHATGRVLFPCASSLFVAEESLAQPPPLIPRSLETGGGAALTPAMCPRAPGLVAHAARGDVWLAGGALGRPTRLTYACRGRDRLSDDPRQAGVPCYVTQEEFSRFTGFWWQPTADDDVFRIVYEEVDESEVKVFSFPSSLASSGDVEEFRFPRAGTPNAKSVLRLVTFRLRPAHAPTVLDCYHDQAHAPTNADVDAETEAAEVVDVRWFDLRRPLKETFPWFEYLARVGWTPCGQYVWVQLLDRKQQRLELALIPLAAFNEPFQYDHAPTAAPAPPDCAPTADARCDEPIQVLVSEQAPDAWVNVHDALHFLGGAGGARGAVSLVWGSERSGYMHLYKLTCQLQPTRQPASVAEMLAADRSDAVGPSVLAEQALTAGDWEVMTRKIWVDEPRGLVYFVGLRESPLERHLYVAPLQPPAPPDPVLLTTPGLSAQVDIDQECTVAVITLSSINSAPETRVYRLAHAPHALLPQGTLHAAHTLPEASRDMNGGAWDSNEDDGCSDTGLLLRERALSGARAQLFRTRLSCGQAAYCALWRGHGGLARAPTVLHVYGGPEVQTVTNTHKGIRQLRMQMLAARGFNVVAIDSRGSKHRGRAWESAIRGRLGQLELDDQVEVLQWLAKETGCIDMERVAIHGWSYGGYLSLLGLATRPNIFKVCVAGAPVTCWRLYDTAYTERYMGPPARAPHAYTRASVLAHAPFFPDQEGRLLIIHGLSDENVHFCHTAALLAELVRLGKPHRVQVYPGERHSLRAMHAAKHYETALLHFLHENL